MTKINSKVVAGLNCYRFLAALDNRTSKREKVPQSMTYNEWKKAYVDKVSQSKMSETKKLIWAAYDSSKILSKEEYGKLRELAEQHKIYLSGIKKFDGKFETVKEIIETIANLQVQFPNVASGKKCLTLTMNSFLDAEDFAITTKIRNINLNANAYRNVELLQKEYQKAVDDGWFIKGTDYQAILFITSSDTLSPTFIKLTGLKLPAKLRASLQNKLLIG